MSITEALMDDAIALLIVLFTVPTLCYIAYITGNSELVYSLASAVVGFYFGKKYVQSP